MISALVLFALAQSPGAPAQHGHRVRENRRARSSSTPGPFSTGLLRNLGDECACANITWDQPAAAITMDRNSRAVCTKRDFTLVSCAANLPRVMAGSPTAPLGLAIDGASTAGLTSDDGRNLASVNWVKSNMTCTRTATGMFADANGGSICTATGANGTATYSITRTIKPGSLSAYVRRRTGTGAISVARDGSTFTAITSDLTSTFKRIVARETPGCMGGNCIVVPGASSNIANPTIVFKIATSGDAIDLDLVQDEPLEWPTSPIDVRFSVNRADELATLAVTMPTGTQYCMAATILFSGGLSSQDVLVNEYGGSLSADVTHLYSTYVDNSTLWVFNYLGSPKTFNTSLGVPLAVPTRITNSYDGANLTGCVDTNCDSSPQSFTQLSGALTYTIGNYSGGAHAVNGVVSDVQIGASPSACRKTMTGATATALGEKWVAIGDSITKAPQAATLNQNWSRALMRLSGWTDPTVRYMSNLAVSSVTTTYMRDVEWASVSGKGVYGLVYLGGINDLIGGADDAATIYARIVTVLDAARAQGARVVPVTVLPASNYVGWDAGRQTKIEALNALILGYCTTHSLTCVDAYTAMGAGTALAAAYDSGDGLHPNTVGSAVLASLIKVATGP